MEPGPFDNREMLYLQHEHRSQYVWDAPVSSSRVVRICLGESAWDILEAIPPHPRVIDILRRGGIYRCIEVGRLVHDRALVTAIIKRWRPETHIFHLGIGEATITLQDVEVIYGLQIDGQALYRVEPLEMLPYRQEMARLTGFEPLQGDMCGRSQLLRSSLHAHLRLVDLQHPIGDAMLQADVDRRARLYLLIIFGGIMFPNTSGADISIRYLLFIEDLEQLGCYSWGAAVLAYMYRGFDRASMGERVEVAAFSPLLQIWVLTRLRPFLPIAAHPPDDYVAEDMPYAQRWSRGRTRGVETHHVILPFRDQLDRITAPESFIVN
ncbi:protein MAIN-LIKE 2-like [Lycium ferocissimum]|uniref:protein MAIN-LIKE 2-like n=1 Tax=Lycium ferocissimum TaxID=112874 RepID=UPI0028157E2B|nr:protein MAIN-LIKE 2-like [Lycium ferocissimum]